MSSEHFSGESFLLQKVRPDPVVTARYYYYVFIYVLQKLSIQTLVLDFRDLLILTTKTYLKLTESPDVKTIKRNRQLQARRSSGLLDSYFLYKMMSPYNSITL